jgi:hypothetical protein
MVQPDTTANYKNGSIINYCGSNIGVIILATVCSVLSSLRDYVRNSVKTQLAIQANKIDDLVKILSLCVIYDSKLHPSKGNTGSNFTLDLTYTHCQSITACSIVCV